MRRVNLHLFFSPIRNETRLLKEAKALHDLRLFEQVVVIGLWDTDLPTQERLNDVLDVVRVKTSLHRWREVHGPKVSSLMGKLLALLSFLQYMVVAIISVRRARPSHVSCHNLLLLPVAWVAALLSSAQLIYVPHELEVERTGLAGSMKHLSRAVERLFIGACHKVVVVCQPIADWYTERYALENVYVVRSIPEVGRSAESLASRTDRRLRHGLPRQGRVFIYQGVLARERGVDALLAVFERRQAESDHLLLMGYGEAVPRIKNAVSGSINIHFIPAVPVSRIVDHTVLADVGVFCLNDPLTLSYQYSLPNKFFEYLAAGIPVIVSPNLRLLSEIVLENQLGWVASIDELETLLHTLTETSISQKKNAIDEYVRKNSWESERLIYAAVYA